MDESVYGMPELRLPSFDVRFRTASQRTEIFDGFRNRYVVLSPEEWVRQHMLHYMVNHLAYPAGLMGVEVSLRLHGQHKRADIVVYGKNADPWMLVECKAAHIALGQDVFDQAARYNLRMRVPYLVITNGMKLIAAKILPEIQEISMLPSMPDYGI
jgi:hypothetical protein